ncbi:MAG: zinc-dependent dehydrogenase [Nitrososphaerota archaeon]|nr:zinc-dependent dehydrogenase [Nitrososphaerota archaeon]MDG7049567.1 zinc-dependent dehydrogenase [Nitrososphaerota archaeon]MDG7051716.1 zinc-dependent dehydrogenase [Nitrososphaerota archaeon]
MKSVIIEGGVGAVVKELPIPTISEGEALIRMKVCGLCGTDIEKLRGQYTASAPILGHEPVGIIDKLGANVRGFNVGDRVFVHHHVPCYNCYYCKHGSETMCDHYRTSNIHPGGFSEYFRVPAWNIERGGMLALPPSISDEAASFIEPAACCIRALNRARVEKGDVVLVSGAGPLGLIHSRLLEERGAKVIISDIRDERLAMAKKLGGRLLLNASKQDYLQAIKGETENRGVDLAVIATGNPAAIAQAFKVVRKGGTVCLFGVPVKGSKLDYDISDIFNSEVNICTNYGGTEKETKEALRLMESGNLNLDDLVTHRFSLERFNDAVATASKGDAMKVIMVP